jgi:hypothetical protein
MTAIVSVTFEETMIASSILKRIFDGAVNLRIGEKIEGPTTTSTLTLNLAGVIDGLESI